MASNPPNTIWSKIQKALDTHTLDQSYVLSSQSPQPKRRSSDQLSAEKEKPHKLNKKYTSHETSIPIIPLFTTSSTSTPTLSSPLSSPMASNSTTAPDYVSSGSGSGPGQKCCEFLLTSCLILTVLLHTPPGMPY